MKEKKIYVCSECGSEDIEELVWRKVNTGAYSGDGPQDKSSNWCCECEEHVNFMLKEEYEQQKNEEQ